MADLKIFTENIEQEALNQIDIYACKTASIFGL